MAQNITEDEENRVIADEITYLLHIRKIGKAYDRNGGDITQ